MTLLKGALTKGAACAVVLKFIRQRPNSASVCCLRIENGNWTLLRKVTYLTAAGNELTGEGLDGVRPLRDLKVFNASGNRVRRIPPSVFAQFRQLQALVLNNNEISEVPPTWLKKGLLTLNTVVLSHNKVKQPAVRRLLLFKI